MTVHSDWGDWLPRAVADAEPDGLAVWYLGCNGFVVKAADGTTLFVDPYFGLGHPPRTTRMIPVPMDPADVEAADAVLATHEHSDHVDGPSQAPILANTGATYYAPDASIDRVVEEEWTDRWAVDADRFVEVGEGDRLEVGSLTVHVEPAHDPLATHPVSYAIEHETGTFFHGGDTRFDESVLSPIGNRREIDLAALAFGAVGMMHDKRTWELTRTDWYCDGAEVIDAAGALQVDRLLPTHWDMWKGLTTDPTALYDHARSFEYPADLEIAEIGDRVDV